MHICYFQNYYLTYVVFDFPFLVYRLPVVLQAIRLEKLIGFSNRQNDIVKDERQIPNLRGS